MMKDREIIVDILYRVLHDDAYANILLRNINRDETDSISFIN